ncbi:glycosyltransferase [Azoarcus communis]|nr:glycosyltransferase [Parazoarcus communis]
MTEKPLKTLALIANQAYSLANFRGPLIRDVVARGHRVVALAPDFDSTTRAAVEALGAETRNYPLARIGMNPWQDLKSLLALRRLLAEIRPDVSLGYFVKPVIYGTLAAAWAGVPHRVALICGLGFAYTEADDASGLKKRWLRAIVTALYRAALARAHVFFFQNVDDQALFLAEKTAAADHCRVVNGTGVDLAEWPSTPLPSLSEYPVTFALAARLLREKGVLEYVAAARIIKARHPSIRFLLLGGLDENPGAIHRTEVQAWVDEGVVEWPGHVPMQSWLAQAHVYVLPSFYREGVPRSTQEAMALGRAVITTDAPGCRETVVAGENGFLIPVRDVPALVQAMESLITTPGLISRMGQASRRLAEARFDVRQINAQMMQALGL